MKDFDWTKFTRKTAIKASMSDLYKAWTSAAQIETWFLKKATYFRDGSPVDRDGQIKEGDKYEWSWYLYEPLEYGKVTSANGKDHFQFTFAGDCAVDVELRQEGEYVIVSITQSNIPTDDASKRNIRLGCESGWSFYLVNLKSLFEGGIDLRNKDASLKGLLNN